MECVLLFVANTCRALMRHSHLTFIHIKGADIRALCSGLMRCECIFICINVRCECLMYTYKNLTFTHINIHSHLTFIHINQTLAPYIYTYKSDTRTSHLYILIYIHTSSAPSTVPLYQCPSYVYMWGAMRCECALHLYFRVLQSVVVICMGWLRSVGSIKSQVFFAKYRLFYRSLLQKRPMI